MKIAIDVRHVKDFGIGTYIRSLVQALGVVDSANHYVLIGSAEAVQSFHDLPQNFETAVYKRPDTDPVDNVGFPAFLHRFAADLVHIPLNRVPLLMPRPY
ncbi:MAG: hypothetical protein HYR60_09340, partial [Acidobacteria bacterium]|nr:hypothetical protein [Acidobacteriota bacterium]